MEVYPDHFELSDFFAVFKIEIIFLENLADDNSSTAGHSNHWREFLMIGQSVHLLGHFSHHWSDFLLFLYIKVIFLRIW